MHTHPRGMHYDLSHPMTQLVAFLRGVNLGKRKMKMDALRRTFEKAGAQNVQTLLASGNVLFEGENTPETIDAIEQQIEADFGFFAETILRSVDDLREMVHADPFDGITENKNTKLYTFFLGPDEAQQVQMPMGIAADFKVTKLTSGEIFAIAWRKENGRFSENLLSITKPFGRYITNRNWNTVLKLITLADKI